MVMNIYKKFLRKYRIVKLKNIKGLTLSPGLNLAGMPIVDIRNGGKVVISNNVTLTSENKGYHLNMHSPVKIYADRPGALIKIGDNTRIHGACIHAHKKILIGKNCLIAGNTQIMDSSGHELSFDYPENRINTSGSAKPVIIEDNVWIGANCIILPDVIIGQGSVVAAGSIVTKEIPSMVIAGGNPAKVIKYI